MKEKYTNRFLICIKANEYYKLTLNSIYKYLEFEAENQYCGNGDYFTFEYYTIKKDKQKKIVLDEQDFKKHFREIDLSIKLKLERILKK